MLGIHPLKLKSSSSPQRVGYSPLSFAKSPEIHCTVSVWSVWNRKKIRRKRQRMPELSNINFDLWRTLLHLFHRTSVFFLIIKYIDSMLIVWFVMASNYAGYISKTTARLAKHTSGRISLCSWRRCCFRSRVTKEIAWDGCRLKVSWVAIFASRK